MKNILLAAACVVLVTGCASKKRKATGAGEKVSGPFIIQTTVPFGPGAVADNVKSECTTLGAKLTNFAVTYGTKRGIEIKKQDKVTNKTKGNALLVTITNVHSGGNAFLGHKKSAALSAELYKDGVLVDSM